MVRLQRPRRASFAQSRGKVSSPTHNGKRKYYTTKNCLGNYRWISNDRFITLPRILMEYEEKKVFVAVWRICLSQALSPLASFFFVFLTAQISLFRGDYVTAFQAKTQPAIILAITKWKNRDRIRDDLPVFSRSHKHRESNDHTMARSSSLQAILKPPTRHAHNKPSRIRHIRCKVLPEGRKTIE
ncbi:hypothetical protein ANTPLA_LOCUS8269 [Anthophora plagiata]